MTDRMINNRVKKIRELEQEAAAIRDELESLKDELKAELDARQQDSIKTAFYNIFYNCFSKRNVDTQKLKDAGLYDQYCKESTVTQFKITDVNPL